jgi:hypothetical protein
MGQPMTRPAPESSDVEQARADLLLRVRSPTWRKVGLVCRDHERLTRENKELRFNLSEQQARRQRFEDLWRDRGGDLARLTREADQLRTAALDLVAEYRSHGGKGTHQRCHEGACCVLPAKVDALAAILEAKPE